MDANAFILLMVLTFDPAPYSSGHSQNGRSLVIQQELNDHAACDHMRKSLEKLHNAQGFKVVSQGCYAKRITAVVKDPSETERRLKQTEKQLNADIDSFRTMMELITSKPFIRAQLNDANTTTCNSCQQNLPDNKPLGLTP